MKRKIIVFCLLICMTCSLWGVPYSAYADETDSDDKTIKVAYLLIPGFQEGAEGEYKNGQGYEYLQKIAAYTGWKYEYVYGTFSELLEKLGDGEIDLMGNLSYTDERAEKISYGFYEQGRESFYLYVKGTGANIRADDYSTINGKRIGVSAGSYQKTLWKKWCEENDIDCELIEFNSSEECEEALENGQIDGTLGSMILSKTQENADWRSVLKFGDAPYYFAVNKNKPELLKELNEAQAAILNENPYYNEELSARYIQQSLVAPQLFTEKEIEWTKTHQGRIKAGYLDDYLPISDLNEDGEPKGVIPDLFSYIEDVFHDYNIHFDLVVYSDYRQMLADLKSGEIDIAAPVYGDYWNAEQEQICVTDPFMSTTMLLIQMEKYSQENIKRIGIDTTSPFQMVYAQIYYPDSEYVLYSSVDEVVNGLKYGKIDAALNTACSYHIWAKENAVLGSANRVTLPAQVGLSMAVSRKNTVLLSIINSGISMVGDTKIFNSLAINSNVEEEFTVANFMLHNPAPVVASCLAVFLILTLIIIRLHKAVRKSKTDPMTGLLNKNAMQEQIKELMGKGGVLFMIDIDNFKSVNDILGHNYGDQLIIHFASALEKIFRTGDIIGRFGGDEFVVFLTGSSCTEEVITAKVDQMQEALERCELSAGDKRVDCSVSVGVLVLQADARINYADAFEKADAALYEAKKHGKKTYVIAG